MARKSSKTTSNAVKILHQRYVKGSARREASLQVEREKASIASQIYDLRTQAGLTQKQLAELIGTNQSVISRLEDADYNGYTFSMLNRIASALHSKVEIRLVPRNDYAFA